ncbi:ABC transporter ATP-binding protein [Methylophilus sp. 5]|uniref:ABC transporter ATP-binding protein n=1 Tax=Methylophilus sp. 5 TaxID=1112274 RepID=UPI0004B3E9F2|nr:ABC transporter ATP-binding protein [Methylophilus sp. 5]
MSQAQQIDSIQQALASEPLLQLNEIEVIYEKVIFAIKHISLQVGPQSIVALLGANGAGKSTILKAISGLAPAQRGEIVQGRIVYAGQDITRATPGQLVAQGLVQVLEGRHCFGHLTVEENLLTGAFIRRPSSRALALSLEKVYAYFPRLKLLRKSFAGYTSGGEQQMVAIGRALMADPKLILLDEPSMGLAPQIVEEIFDIVHQLQQTQGLSFLLAEQNASVALRYANYAYVLESGHITHHGDAHSIASSQALSDSYLGGR